ncbi:bifunctional diguanylate cyclase/phosphodiesterase [Candidatus Stoquefichus massiliensis]|uniref:bifunctional diguanylate cyclase/phosphodiesterase n=1 Tax=Candidatus Stoquefichus massiliensis TaxID=1470350 RepID=UPI000488ABDB|nr:GGDEF domain-containing phosphodiesterase [Candidatus Stoquefichus massiliensis]
MAGLTKSEELNVDIFFELLSESTDDYLFMWDIQNGVFHISENAFIDFNIDHSIRENVVDVWSSIMVNEDIPLWLNDMQMLQEGIKDYHDMEYRVYNREGQVIWVSCRGKVSQDSQGHPLYLIGRISNIGKENKFDNITGLKNRKQFEKDLGHLINSDKQTQGVVVVLDIDNFKNINERYGYAFGDRALNLISTKLIALLPKGCQMYRLDGDEFAFLIKNGSEQSTQAIYEDIQLYVTNHFIMDDQRLYISLSAGACFYPKDGHSYQKLFRHAENAVEIAKMNGKNQLVFFSKEMYQRKLKIIELQESLHATVANGFQEFELYYQPQIDVKTKSVVGAEALLRWHSPKHGEVSPIEFIPLLEESQLIIQVGKWVLEEAIKQCQIWQKYNQDFTMSINVSYIQLKENALLEYLKNEHSHSPINHCILELTENCWIPNLQFINQEFRNIQEMGYGIAIDDFGTGYSSLSHLKELPANVIKIDRSFIQGIKEESYEYIFLEYIVKLAHVTHLKVCVEGVETEEEYHVVKKTDPDYIQGFLFGRPVSASEFEKMYFHV